MSVHPVFIATVDGKQYRYSPQPSQAYRWGLVEQGLTGWIAVSWFKSRKQLDIVRREFNSTAPYAVARLERLT